MQSEYILGQIDPNRDNSHGLPLSSDWFCVETQSWQLALLAASAARSGRGSPFHSLAGMEFLLLLLVLLIGALLAAWVASRWLWRKGMIGKCILAITAAGICWSVYDAIYPSESFYSAELQRLVEVKLPSDAVFLEKDATFPDHFGDYSACFIVRLTPTAMDNFRSQLGNGGVTGKSVPGCKPGENLAASASENLQFDLSLRATRKDAIVSIDLILKDNLARVSWSLW